MRAPETPTPPTGGYKVYSGLSSFGPSLTPHDAAGSLSGYRWQIGRTLLKLLEPDNKMVRIEQDDDITTADAAGNLVSALQAKHVTSGGALTLGQAPWWLTVRVWTTLSAREPPPESFTLLTTQTVSATDSLLALTRPHTEVDTSSLEEEMSSLAQARGTKALEGCYEAWLALTKPARLDLLQRASILHGQPTLQHLRAQVQAAAHKIGVPDTKAPAAAIRLVGWFELEVNDRLPKASFTSQEVREALWTFKDDAESELFAALHGADPVPAGAVEEDQAYLKQLHLIDADDATLLHAASNYYRATADRNEWRNTKLLGKLRLQQFDQDLVNNWEGVCVREGASNCKDDDKVIVGRRIHVEATRHLGVLGAGAAPYHVAVGSHHLLANELTIGWHPDYRKRL